MAGGLGTEGDWKAGILALRGLKEDATMGRMGSHCWLTEGALEVWLSEGWRVWMTACSNMSRWADDAAVDRISRSTPVDLMIGVESMESCS